MNRTFNEWGAMVALMLTGGLYFVVELMHFAFCECRRHFRDAQFVFPFLLQSWHVLGPNIGQYELRYQCNVLFESCCSNPH